MTTTLPNTNGNDTADERYDKALRAYNVATSRLNSAIDALEWAEREYADAERWFTESRDDLNRAASVVGRPGAP